MGREPISMTKITRIFEKIEGRIEPAADPKLGAYLLELVKTPDEFKRFRANPSRALQAKGLNPRHVKSDILVGVVQSVIDRLTDLGFNPGDVMDQAFKQETSSHQERNFDHSSSWFTNKDGWNVMHDGGHSSEKSSTSQVGQDHKFDGIGLSDFGDVMQRTNAMFFPAQPLVSPKLIDEIKAAAKEVGQ